jgi:hypothetical protein
MTDRAAVTSTPPSTWGLDPAPYPLGHKVALLLPGVAAATAAGAIAGIAFSSLLGVAVAVAVFLVSLLVFVTSSSWAARVLDANGSPTPRVANIAAGLATQLGLPPPRLIVVERGGPNALATVDRGTPVVALTRSLMEGYPRTELEATIASCLVRVKEGHLRYSAAAARYGRWATRFAPAVGGPDDVHAAALTRYPPALASAISKADPSLEARLGPLWFVWDGPSHVPSEHRERALLAL